MRWQAPTRKRWIGSNGRLTSALLVARIESRSQLGCRSLAASLHFSVEEGRFGEMKPQFPIEQTESGEFQRQEDTFREWISNDGSTPYPAVVRSEEHTSELQSRFDLVCRLLLEKKKKK